MSGVWWALLTSGYWLVGVRPISNCNKQAYHADGDGKSVLPGECRCLPRGGVVSLASPSACHANYPVCLHQCSVCLLQWSSTEPICSATARDSMHLIINISGLVCCTADDGLGIIQHFFRINRHYWTLITLECGTIRFAWLRFSVQGRVCLPEGWWSVWMTTARSAIVRLQWCNHYVQKGF